MPSDEMVEKAAASFSETLEYVRLPTDNLHEATLRFAMRAAIEAAIAAMTGAGPVGSLASYASPNVYDGTRVRPSPPRSTATDEIAAIAESLRDAYPMEASRILVLLGRA